MMQVILSNSKHPEYGQATIPFPLAQDQYEDCVELLEKLEIGNVMERDCKVEEIQGGLPILKRLEKVAINIDELDYLVKRLDSFDSIEEAQFQAMAVKLGTFDMTDLINLTFCCQQATVITDFSDLDTVGRHHIMSINGGCAPSELAQTDLRMTALKLILSKEGTVTPYGVVYDNGMKLEQVYDGRHLPGYHYGEDLLAVGISSRAKPENTSEITWLYLPCSELQIERGMQRSGIRDPDDMRIWYEDSQLPKEVENALEFKRESIFEMNELAAAIEKLSPADRKKLEAAVTIAEPECASQIRHLAENLDLFDFVPDTKTPEDYGRYMIRESGHFDYDENLEQYYDYAGYFALLMDKVAKQEGERLEQLNQELIEDPNFEVPETTDQKCLRTIERCFARQQRRTALRGVTHILHFAAIIVAVSVLLFTTAFAVSEDFRVATRNLLITVNERYTDFRMKIEDSSGNTSQASVSGQSSNGVGDASYFDHLVVGWIPEEFQLVKNRYNRWVYYENGNDNWIYILMTNEDSALQIDTENAEIADATIHDLPAVIVKKDGGTTILLTDENQGYFYVVSTSSGIDFETTTKITESLIM